MSLVIIASTDFSFTFCYVISQLLSFIERLMIFFNFFFSFSGFKVTI